MASLAAAHPQELAIYFRNFPLTDIHPDAFAAATAAEVARMNGQFALAHALLYSHPLPSADYEPFYKAVGISMVSVKDFESQARKRVADDLNYAIQLGLKGTPAFFLIDDTNSVYSLASLDAAHSFLADVK